MQNMLTGISKLYLNRPIRVPGCTHKVCSYVGTVALWHCSNIIICASDNIILFNIVDVID
jgi:hypothetical protein